MKATSDYLSGPQLELDVELGLSGLDVDLHDVTFCPWRFVQVNCLQWVASFDFGCDQLPSRDVGEVVLE